MSIELANPPNSLVFREAVARFVNRSVRGFEGDLSRGPHAFLKFNRSNDLANGTSVSVLTHLKGGGHG